MKKAFLFFVISCVSILFLHGQSAIVPLGGDAQGVGGSVSYTVGQVAVNNAQNGTGSVTVQEGVQQPYEIMTVGVNHYPQISLNAVVYPNPTENLVQLELNGFELPDGGLQAHLFDMRGKKLGVVSVTDDITTFQIGQYATGNYLIELRDGKRILKTFKVVRK